MLNKVIITGRLTADPEYRITAGEVPVASFSVAVDRDYKNKDGERPTDFFNVTAWRGTADFVTNYFTKGSQIIVDGRLELHSWTDQDGNKRKGVVIVAERLYFAGGKKKENDTERQEPPLSGVDDYDPDMDPETPF